MSELLTYRRLVAGAVTASLLLSAWAGFSDSSINNDGTLYLDAAHQLLLGDWGAAYALFDWPFYSALIAGLAWLTGLELLTAGLALNAALYAGVVWAFVALLRVLGADTRTLAVGALLILVYPEFNEDRADLLRGPGMWAALLLGLAWLMRLREGWRLRHAFGWSGALLVAALFRVEALAFLALMPPLLLLDRQAPLAQRVKAALACFLLPGLALLGALLGLQALGLPQGRLLEPLGYLQALHETIAIDLPRRAEALLRHVFDGRIEHYGLESIYALILLIALLSFIKRAGLLYLLLAGAAVWTRRWPRHGRLLLGLLAVNLGYVLAHLAVDTTVSSRYATPACLMAIVYASYGLAGLWTRLGARPRGWALQGALALALLATAIDGLHSFGASKAHLRTAGEWLAAELPAGRQLLSNDHALAHYAGIRSGPAARLARYNFANALERGSLSLALLQPGDYLAIRTEKMPPATLAQLQARPELEELKVFAGEQGRRVVIYRARAAGARRFAR